MSLNARGLTLLHMGNFFTDALKSLLLDKKARDALEGRAPARPKGAPTRKAAKATGDAKPPSDRNRAAPENRASALEPRPPAIAGDTETARQKREALIQQALQVRAQKENLLNDLDDETRAKLVLAAMRAFTGKDSDGRE